LVAATPAAAAPSQTGAPTVFWTSGVFEALAAFAILLPLLFVPQLTTAGPAMSFAAVLGYGWIRRREAVAIFARRWALLLIPAYALASLIWSDHPDVTLKHALELVMTVAGGLLMSASRRPAALLAGACGAFGLYLLVSLTLGHSVTVGSAMSGGETAFTGLNEGKNLLGMTAALGALLSVFLLTCSLRRRFWAGVIAALGLAAIGVLMVYLSRSAGAVIAFTLAAATLLVVASLGAFRPRNRGVVCAVLALLLLAGGMFGYAFANSVTAEALNLFHKDPTLTGRSYLWYRAMDFVRERPMFGRGFEAFWVQGDLDAEGIWQYAHVGTRMGFNFHNTLIELLIHFGWVGAVLTLAVFLFALLRLMRRAVREPSLVAAFYLGLVVFQLSRTPFESLMPASVDFETTLLMAALGFGFEPIARLVAAPARPSPLRRPYRTLRPRPGFAPAAARPRIPYRRPRPSLPAHR